jgi:hypothetical protein
MQNKPNFVRRGGFQVFVLQALIPNLQFCRKPIQSQFKPNQTQFKPNFYLNKANSNPNLGNLGNIGGEREGVKVSQQAGRQLHRVVTQFFQVTGIKVAIFGKLSALVSPSQETQAGNNIVTIISGTVNKKIYEIPQMFGGSLRLLIIPAGFFIHLI